MFQRSKKDGGPKDEGRSSLRDLEEARESFTGFDPEDPPASLGNPSVNHPRDGVQTDHRRLTRLLQ